MSLARVLSDELGKPKPNLKTTPHRYHMPVTSTTTPASPHSKNSRGRVGAQSRREQIARAADFQQRARAPRSARRELLLQGVRLWWGGGSCRWCGCCMWGCIWDGAWRAVHMLFDATHAQHARTACPTGEQPRRVVGQRPQIVVLKSEKRRELSCDLRVCLHPPPYVKKHCRPNNAPAPGYLPCCACSLAAR